MTFRSGFNYLADKDNRGVWNTSPGFLNFSPPKFPVPLQAQINDYMKIHRPLAQAVVQALAAIFREGKHADKVIERVLKSNPKWGSRDRAFIAENVYECVRWRRLLVALAGDVPQFGKENDGVLARMLGVNLILAKTELPAWEEFAGLDAAAVFREKEKLESAGDRKVLQSIPDWLDETGAAELGSAWDAELAALNQMAPIVLRANTLKIKRDELAAMLRQRGWEAGCTDLSPDALVLERRGNVFVSPMFKNGFFEVQDAGSQCIAPFLQVKPGMRVVDACAGAGGKTLHLAALMQNKGSITALDTEFRKLEELRRRARRNGAHIVQARHIESTKTIKRLHGTADRLLLDVPCSGLGTLRRNPDAKWKRSPDFLESVKATQAQILRDYSKMLRPGGMMVYATCSILPSENEQQVARFLTENPAFHLQAERWISPAKEGFDGFYMALMARE